jgi:hypothetical protein
MDEIPSPAFSERRHTLPIFTRGFKAFILSHVHLAVAQNLMLPFIVFSVCLHDMNPHRRLGAFRPHGSLINIFKEILWIRKSLTSYSFSRTSMGIGIEAHVKKKILFLPLRPCQKNYTTSYGGIEKSSYNA